MRFIFIILIGFITLKGHSQDTIPVKAEYILFSPLNYQYRIHNKTIAQISTQGKDVWNYTFPGTLNIDFCDVSNPLAILVYNQASNTIYLLDNTLTPLGDPLPLDVKGYSDVSIVCSSTQAGFWIFENSKRQILHINASGNMTRNGISLLGIKGYSNDFPEFLTETSDYIITGFPESGIFVFNKNGTLNTHISISPLKIFSVCEKEIIVFDNENYYSIHAETAKKEIIVLPKAIIKSLYYCGNNFHYFDGNQIISKNHNENKQ